MVDAYLRPDNLRDAVEALRAGQRTVLAGGTDFYPQRVGEPLDEPVLDVSGVAELRGIECGPKAVRIGAATCWAAIARATLPPALRGLQLAAREIGGAQIQNAGTLGGNLCNASPAADGVPPLLAADAEVELVSTTGRRRMPLARFVLGSRRTARAPAELLTAVHVPTPSARTRSTFLKLGTRRYLVISVVMVAIVVELDSTDRIRQAGICVGACAPVARRLAAAEAALLGARLASGVEHLVEASHLAPLSPIDDVRSSAAYRIDAALTLVRRGLAELAENG